MLSILCKQSVWLCYVLLLLLIMKLFSFQSKTKNTVKDVNYKNRSTFSSVWTYGILTEFFWHFRSWSYKNHLYENHKAQKTLKIKIFFKNHAEVCLQSFKVSILWSYNFIDSICTCLLHLKNMKFFLSIYWN